VWERDIGVYPVPWPEQGDEWVFHLSRILTGHEGGLGGRGSPTVGEVILDSPGDSLRSSLRVRRHLPEGVACTVLGEGDGGDDQVEPWQNAASAAVAELGKHDRDFTWEVILGPSPRWWDLPQSPLAKQEALGPVQLTPGGVCMRELLVRAPDLIDKPVMGRYSWPLIASGVERTYRLAVADERVRTPVRQACALLSLFWGRHWLPRSSLRVVPRVTIGDHSLTVPQSVGPWENLDLGPLSDDFNTYTGDTPPLALPAWASDAWAVLEHDAGLRKAVQAHYEAVSLEMAHPSASFLFYVTAIEGIGIRHAESEGPADAFARA
jgi:hypothetical protein